MTIVSDPLTESVVLSAIVLPLPDGAEVEACVRVHADTMAAVHIVNIGIISALGFMRVRSWWGGWVSKRRVVSAESTGDVVLGLFLFRPGENARGVSHL